MVGTVEEARAASDYMMESLVETKSRQREENLWTLMDKLPATSLDAVNDVNQVVDNVEIGTRTTNEAFLAQATMLAAHPNARPDISNEDIPRILMDGPVKQKRVDMVKRFTFEVRENTLRHTKVVVHCFNEKMRDALVHVLRDRVPEACLLYTSPSPRDLSTSRMPSSA